MHTLEDEPVDVIGEASFKRTERIPCLFCKQFHPSRKIHVAHGMFAMVAECPNCRVAFQTPRPAIDASIAYMNSRWKAGDKYVADECDQLGRAQMQLGLLRSVSPTMGRLLDFGAGAGAFVKVAQSAGWDVIGLESSSSAIERAKALHDVSLFSTLPNSSTFDAITLWDVIEHLRDPLDTLQWLKRNLRPGGVVLVETGNYESWLRTFLGDKWGLYLFDHQTYFTPHSLGNLLKHAGFRDIVFLPTKQTLPPKNPLKFVQQPFRSALKWFHWLNARLRWPKHGDRGIIVGAARA